MNQEGSGERFYFFTLWYAHALDSIKCFWVFHYTLYTIQCTGVQGKYHKYIIGNSEWCYDTVFPCRAKPVPGIISRVADDDNNTMPKRPAYIESLFNERGANSTALIIRMHHMRGKWIPKSKKV